MAYSFGGKVLFLDRSDINTDEIIPARYLTEISKEALAPYLLEDLKLEGFDPKRDLEGVKVIVTRENFGCGSSREHAVWALEVNGITTVIAAGFARIFRQNMFNCGLLAITLAPELIDDLFREFSAGEALATIDLAKSEVTIRGGKKEKTVPFELGPFERTLVEAGGWVEYADAHY